eukprot:5678760-Ditylum_brightwellii.AAC.1
MPLGHHHSFWNFATTKELINTYSSYTGLVDNVDSSCDSEESNDADEKQAEDECDETFFISTLQQALGEAMG